MPQKPDQRTSSKAGSDGTARDCLVPSFPSGQQSSEAGRRGIGPSWALPVSGGRGSSGGAEGSYEVDASASSSSCSVSSAVCICFRVTRVITGSANLKKPCVSPDQC